MIVNYHLYVNSDIEYKRICFFKSPAPIDHWMSSFVYDVASNALKKPLLVLSSLLSHRISIMPNCQVDPHFNPIIIHWIGENHFLSVDLKSDLNKKQVPPVLKNKLNIFNYSWVQYHGLSYELSLKVRFKKYDSLKVDNEKIINIE